MIIWPLILEMAPIQNFKGVFISKTGIKPTKREIMNQNKSAHLQETLKDNNSWLLKIFTLFQSGKMRSNLRIQKWQLHSLIDLCGILIHFFSVYTTRDQDPDHLNKISGTLQSTEQQKKRHFLRE